MLAAVQNIAALAAPQSVVPSSANQAVVPRIAVNDVLANAALDGVIAAAASDRVPVGRQCRVGGSAHPCLRLVPANDAVGIAVARQNVAEGRAGQVLDARQRVAFRIPAEAPAVGQAHGHGGA